MSFGSVTWVVYMIFVEHPKLLTVTAMEPHSKIRLSFLVGFLCKFKLIICYPPHTNKIKQNECTVTFILYNQFKV